MPSAILPKFRPLLWGFATSVAQSAGVAAIGLALTSGAAAIAQTAPVATPAKIAAPSPATVAPFAARSPLPDGKPLPGSAANQLIERIQVDDADVRIEETRFGGETRSITVIPKGGFPSYDVRPSTGHSTWKILGF